jgi:hypothetical protein
MPRVGCEPTIPVFERAKMVHALDRTANKIRWKVKIIRKCKVYSLVADYQLIQKHSASISVLIFGVDCTVILQLHIHT